MNLPFQVHSKDLGPMTDALLNLEGPSFEAVDAVLKKFQPDGIPPFSLQPHLPVINDCFDANSLEAIFSRLGEKGDNEFSSAQITELRKMVPLGWIY